MTIAEKLVTIAENIPKVHEAGQVVGQKEAEDVFWNVFTNNGERTFYEYAFRQSGFEYIRPTIKIVPKNCRSISMFQDCKSLKRVEKQYFDLSNVNVSTGANVNGHYNFLNNCTHLEEVEDIGLPAGGHYYTFFNCYNLHTVAVLRLTRVCKFNNVFTNCRSLQNITIEGEIDQTGLNFSWSPLTIESMKSIIISLVDLTGTSGEHNFSIKFSDNCWNKLESDSNAPHGGTWREYVQDVLCWNI